MGIEHNDNVSYREFAEQLRAMELRHITRGDEIKSLIITQTNHAIETAALHHQSMNSKLAAQDAKLDKAVDELSAKIDGHTDEDREVEKRVTRIEETNKRFIWLGLVAMPSFLAAWEAIKRNVLR